MTVVRTHDVRVSAAVVWRVGVTLVWIVIVETVVCAAAALPVVALWSAVLDWISASALVRAIAFSVLVVPSYIAFALCLMFATAAANRLTAHEHFPTRRCASRRWDGH
jgi:Ni/Fe-hydrogenase subunit HybB-like protein